MAPTYMFDISGIDPDACVYDTARINEVNPHRGVMRLLDRIVWTNEDHSRTVAVKDIGDQEFWVQGHFPNRPLFPGVLMIEAAGQLASFQYYCHVGLSNPNLLGFVGVDKVKFRGNVVPGDQLMILSELADVRTRRIICNAQGCVRGNLVFEAQITGMSV